jgi:hypothetical protein
MNKKPHARTLGPALFCPSGRISFRVQTKHKKKNSKLRRLTKMDMSGPLGQKSTHSFPLINIKSFYVSKIRILGSPSSSSSSDSAEGGSVELGLDEISTLQNLIHQHSQVNLPDRRRVQYHSKKYWKERTQWSIVNHEPTTGTDLAMNQFCHLLHPVLGLLALLGVREDNSLVDGLCQRSG